MRILKIILAVLFFLVIGVATATAFQVPPFTFGATILQAPQGGTGIGSYTVGDLIVATGANTLTKVPIGSAGEALTVTGGTVGWSSVGGTTSTWYGPISSNSVTLSGDTRTSWPSSSATSSWYGPIEWNRATGTDLVITNSLTLGGDTKTAWPATFSTSSWYGPIEWSNATGSHTTTTELTATGGITLGGVRNTVWPSGTTSSWYGPLEWSNTTGTNATTTNLGVTNLANLNDLVFVDATGSNLELLTSLIAPLANITNLTWTNATGTNLYVTNNITALGVASSSRFIASPGSASAPGFTFNGDLDTGISQGTNSSIVFSVAGTLRMQIYSDSSVKTGTVYPLANNTYTLGTSAAGWSNLYASGTAYIGTDVKVGDGASAQSVCLFDGSNCPSSVLGGNFWTYDGTDDTLRPNTSTTDIKVSKYVLPTTNVPDATASFKTFDGGVPNDTAQFGYNLSDTLYAPSTSTEPQLWLGFESNFPNNPARDPAFGTNSSSEMYVRFSPIGGSTSADYLESLFTNYDRVTNKIIRSDFRAEHITFGNTPDGSYETYFEMFPTYMQAKKPVQINGTGGISLAIQDVDAIQLIKSTTGANRTRLRFQNTGGISEIGQDNSAGTGIFGVASPAYSLSFRNQATTPIIFGHTSPEVTILDGGNVGIGTTSPSAKLDVAGEVSSTAVTVSGVSVCLEDGSNCPASVTGASQWTYDSAGDFVRPNTSTTAVSSTQFVVSTGTAALPSYSFNGDRNTGLFSYAADGLYFSTGGTTRLQISTSNVISSLNVLPSTHNTYNLGAPGTNAWKNINASGTVSGSGFYANSGNASLPTFSFSTDTNTGIYQLQPDSIDFTVGGVLRADLNTSYMNFNVSVLPLYDGAYVLGAPTVRWAKIDVIGVSSTGQVSIPNMDPLGITSSFACLNASNGTLQKMAANCTVSSIRFKEHIDSLSDRDLMEKVLELRAVGFDYREENGGKGLLGTSHDEGFIAEEVALIDPYLVVWETVPEGDEGLLEVRSLYPSVPMEKDGMWMIPKSVDYMKISVLLTGAVQDMDSRLTELESRMGILERILGFLKELFD
jgi:hypothetical protein